MSSELIETYLMVLTSLFALVDPIGNAVIFASLTPTRSAQRKRKIAIKGVIIATGLLFMFMLLGEGILSYLGISIAALRTSGGILLLIIGIEMVFARPSTSTSTTDEEIQEALQKDAAKEDVSVFPLATPLIAGPATIGAIIIFQTNTQGNVQQQGAVFAALLTIMVVTLICLLSATFLQRLLGTTGMNVINRIMGVLLSALAVQLVFDGLANSGLF